MNVPRATRRQATATRPTCSTSPASWENAADDAVNVAWARDCFEATRSCSTGGTYLNFLTEEEGRDRIEAAYGPADLHKLASLKRRYDPDNLFRHTKRVAA